MILSYIELISSLVDIDVSREKKLKGICPKCGKEGTIVTYGHPDRPNDQRYMTFKHYENGKSTDHYAGRARSEQEFFKTLSQEGNGKKSSIDFQETARGIVRSSFVNGFQVTGLRHLCE